MQKKISVKKTLAALLALVMLVGTLAVLPVTVSAAATIESCAPKGTANIAVGSVVTVSNCTANRAGAQNSYEMPTENWSKAMLVDGKLNNGWSTDPYDKETDRSEPVTVTLKFPTPSEISCVALFPNGCFPAKYTVSISADGKAYTKIADGTCDVGQPTEPAIHSFAATTASYVQIHVTERSHTVTGDGALVQFGEIAVYGKAEAAMSTQRKAYELLVGDTDTISPTFIGVGNDTPAVTYQSKDTSVATVDATGKITAKKLGKTAITVSCASLGMTTEVSVSVVEKRFDFDDNILISIFWPPTPEYITDEQYKLIADAGVNWVLGAGEETLATPENQAKMLELCAKYGIGMTVSDGSFGRNLLGKSKAQIAEYVNRYKNVPGAYGFYILDEPFNANEFVPAYIALKKAAPDAYMHLNFLPGHAYSSQKQYYSQINDWATLCANSGYPLDYIMFDHYPFLLQPGVMARDTFMANMRTVHNVGLDNDVKTGLYIQTVRQDVAFRRPTDSEIRYEMYLSLAFGFKQLSFFTWFTPINRSEPFSDGIISADGKPNAHYETIKTINHEILAIGETLVKCDALEIYLNGESWGQPSIPEDFFVQPTDKKNYTVSFLRHKESGRNYLMVVNNDFARKQSLTLEFDKAITSLSEVSRVDGSLKALKMDGQKLNLDLAAGDGMLIALPEGFDHHKPADTSKPSANTNLATLPGASVSATTSKGSGGYYIDLLTDGERFSNGASMGWSSNDREAGQINLDLGAVRQINRVDLYPCGDQFDYGRTFPSEFTLSVSADGKAYTPVAEIKDYKVKDDVGCSITFDQVSAQYIRIDTPKGRRAVTLCEIEIYNDNCTVGEMQAVGQIIGEDMIVDYEDGDNIALKKPTYVSSAAPDTPYMQWGWSQSYINDGIAGSGNGYTSNVGLNPTPDATEYAIVDFGDLFALEQIKITPLGAFPEDYTLAVSTDGKTWTDIFKATGAPSPSEAVVVTPEGGSSNARFLRFMGTKLRGGGNDGYLLQFSEIEAYGKPICDKSVIENVISLYMEKVGDESAAAYTDAKAALEDTTLTQSQANDFAQKLYALLPPEEPTEPETSAPTEPVVTEPQTSNPGDATAEATDPAVTETNAPVDENDTGCASVAALSLLALLPLSWWGLRKKRD